MKRMCAVLFGALPAVCLAQSGAISHEWEVREALTQLVSATKRLQPILDQIQAKDWIARGAPSTYVDQTQAIKNEINYLERTVGDIKKDPQRVSKTLEAYLRVQSIDAMLRSLSEGIRRYQNPAVADLLLGVMSENSEQVQKLRDYMVELVEAKEAEFKIADAEAQRCRAKLMNQPVKVPVKGPQK